MQNITKKLTNFNTHILPWVVCLLAALFYFYEFILRVAPSVMINQIMKEYAINATQFGFLTACYYYAYTPMQILVGLLVDKYGPRKFLCLSIISCVIGCILMSYFPNYLIGKLSLFLIGFGSAFAFVGVIKLAVNWLPANKLSFITGLTSTLGLIGGIFAETIMNKIVSIIGWLNSWGIMAIIGLLILIITIIVVSDHPDEHNNTNIIKLRDVRNISFIKLFQELTDLLKNKQFLLNGLIGACMYLPIALFGSLWGIPFLETGAHFAKTQAANILPLIFLGMAIGSPLIGYCSEKFGHRKIILQIGAFVSAILFTIILFNPGMNIYLLSGLLFTLGLITSTQILVFPLGIDLSPKKLSGTAVAITNFLVMCGVMFLHPIVGKILDLHWSGQLLNGARVFSLYDYQLALLIIPISLITCSLMAFFLRETHYKYHAKKLTEKTNHLKMLYSSKQYNAHKKRNFSLI